MEEPVSKWERVAAAAYWSAAGPTPRESGTCSGGMPAGRPATPVRDHVRVCQTAEDVGLPAEPADRRPGRHDRRQDRLDRDQLAVGRPNRSVHDAHVAAAKLAFDPVAGDGWQVGG